MLEKISRLAEDLNVAVVADAAMGLTSPKATTGMATSHILERTPGTLACGPAYTLRLSPAREIEPDLRDRVFNAYEDAPEGAVVVIQVVGDVGGGILGDVIAHAWKNKKVAGVVVDGPVRDVAAIGRLNFPMWSRSVTMRGLQTRETETEVNVDVTIDSVRVANGDLVVADADGVFVVPQHLAPAVLDGAEQLIAEEARTHVELDKGKTLLECYGAPLPPSDD